MIVIKIDHGYLKILLSAGFKLHLKYNFLIHGGPIYLPIKYRNFAQRPFKMTQYWFRFDLLRWPINNDTIISIFYHSMTIKDISFMHFSTFTFFIPIQNSYQNNFGKRMLWTLIFSWLIWNYLCFMFYFMKH